jgi:predicted NACHT family NTPase
MFIPEELVDIIKRIASSTHTEADLQKLGQIFDVTVAAGERSIAINRDANGATITTGDTILNITFQADGLLIGEKVYQGDGAKEVKSLLKKIFQPKVSIDWQKGSRDLLDEQIQRLTSNPLTHTEGIAYRTEQVYVPLGLVERKRQSRRGGDVTPAQGSLLYEETEITQKFEHSEFLEQVLQHGKSPRSSGKRIAIIGEPGAGKTTLLQQIARWVSDNIDRSIVIWISLADLQGQSLEQYLLERWLPAILQRHGQAEVFAKEKNALLAQFQQQQVWLVLDGADEMQMSSGSPLSEIGQQIRTGALLQQARMVLSCRLNLWDGSSNALDSFDNYRTLEFSYPQQVEQFIDDWFGSAPSDKTYTGQTLCNVLREVGKERIQDLVKNPLRLTLLCFNWYLGEGKLPETKAGLYEQFVDDFYEWKKGIFATTGEQRRRLNVALGELAREAIDLEEIRFRLRQEFICKYLGEPEETDSLFWLALKLGWLNPVGVEAENPKKRVYSFFHPTFQEYFAAASVNDWHFFLNHFPDDPSHPEASYRVFESQWKEVYLLWLGQTKINRHNKEYAIISLTNFKDDCDNLYKYKTYCIAAWGIAEFGDCSLTESIIRQIVNWYFGYIEFELDNEPTVTFHKSIIIDDLMRIALKETHQKSLVKYLTYLINNSSYESTRNDAISCLREFGYNNKAAIEVMIDLASKDENKKNRQNALESLGRMSKQNVAITNALNLHLLNTNDDEEKLQAAKSLAIIDIGNQDAIKLLTDTLIEIKDPCDCSEIAWIIQKSDIYNDTCYQMLKNISITTIANEQELFLCSVKLINVKSDDSDAIYHLKHILNSSVNRDLKFSAAIVLLKNNGNDKMATSVLISALQDNCDLKTKISIIKCLGLLTSNNLDAILALNQLLNVDMEDNKVSIFVAEMLGNCAVGNDDSILALTKIMQEVQDCNLKCHFAGCLGEIDPGNQDAIDTLISVLDNTDNEAAKIYAIDRISKIGYDDNNVNVIAKLRQLISEGFDRRVVQEAGWNLWLYSAIGIHTVYPLIREQLFNSLDIEAIRWGSTRLKILLSRNINEDIINDVVTRLDRSLSIEAYAEKREFYKIYFDIAIFCLEKMSYLNFCKAYNT